MRTLRTAIAALFLLAACSSPDPAPAPTEALPDPEIPSSAPAPVFRPATVGQPFELGFWRITVTSIRCGTRAELKIASATSDDLPTERVCAAFFSYVNIDKVPHLFGGTFDENPPERVYAGEAADGSRYEGTSWLQGTANPGLGGATELIFKVPDGITLAAVEIGDVRVVTTG